MHQVTQYIRITVLIILLKMVQKQKYHRRIQILVPKFNKITKKGNNILTQLQIKLLLNTSLYLQGKHQKPLRQTQFMRYRDQMVLEVLLIMMKKAICSQEKIMVN